MREEKAQSFQTCFYIFIIDQLFFLSLSNDHPCLKTNAISMTKRKLKKQPDTKKHSNEMKREKDVRRKKRLAGKDQQLGQERLQKFTAEWTEEGTEFSRLQAKVEGRGLGQMSGFMTKQNKRKASSIWLVKTRSDIRVKASCGQQAETLPWYINSCSSGLQQRKSKTGSFRSFSLSIDGAWLQKINVVAEYSMEAIRLELWLHCIADFQRESSVRFDQDRKKCRPKAHSIPSGYGQGNSWK